MPLRWKKRRQREIPQRISDVNMTPLIDLTFLLLITFLITLPLMENSISVKLPVGKADKLPDKKSQNVTLNASGAIHLNNRPVSIEQLEDGLRQAALKDPAVAVLIRGDEKLDYGKVVGVMKVLYKLKITRMALVTQAD
jgi:biopolymer transport protein ExbD